MDITGKVAIVTGAGSGIGRASALRLARAGAAFVRADVTSEKDVGAMIEFAERTYGGLDILHNNAGIITGPPRWPDTEPERWTRLLDINLKGVILGTQLAIPALRRRGGGVIVHTASLAGIG